MQNVGLSRPSGGLGLAVIKSPDREAAEWSRRNKMRVGYWAGLAAVKAAKLLTKLTGIPTMTSQVSLVKVRADGTRVPLGIAGFKVVTDAGVGFIVDAFQNSVELENMKFHGIGTGSTAEDAGDTALVTELTTQYSTDNTRATGSTEEGATANIFKTVGTNQVDAAVGIQEHGVFSQAATGGGVLLDRTVFSVVNLSNGDSLQSTYELTLNSGS